MLWKCLGWEERMPQWAHLPLIMGPDGAKLSKRHGNKYGFPIFAMNWTDPVKNDADSDRYTEGFRERGFLPEAFINLLALLGWNDGTGQEIFTKEELVKQFSLERVHSAGAQFDYEKAKWYNHEWIKRLPAGELLQHVRPILEKQGLLIPDNSLLKTVIDLVKERCTLLTDFYEQAAYFYVAPAMPDTESIKPKWNEAKQLFFAELVRAYQLQPLWHADSLEQEFKELAAANNLKPGELMLPLRIMLVGGKFGPGVFQIAELIGREQTVDRIRHVLSLLQ
jgi:glutamyl-tRNA synthetase